MKLVGWTSMWVVLMASTAFAQVGVVVDDPEEPVAAENEEAPAEEAAGARRRTSCGRSPGKTGRGRAGAGWHRGCSIERRVRRAIPTEARCPHAVRAEGTNTRRAIE